MNHRRIVWTNAQGSITGGHYLYVAYGPPNNPRPLYAGITHDVIYRLAEHRARSRTTTPSGVPHWWSETELIVVTRYDTEAEARAEERAFIRANNPVHNFVRYQTVKD